ncbi:D-alanyl-D-alanine dipeptidase [Roseospira goensis]|uniref:D-alanyl-D-alanine dipeptidase n=1 Tax=Roseospira goensis TaxID=391922 RepID=A0A7W6S3P4_9PROT|nr:D-alanyl-D-alanine dipeptidase [Roseospira goensis]MBB4287574.1 D-alanyl-D-alanine dipeptidase [Roseospira goensis]
MLIEITPEGYDVDLDLLYATPDNITGRPIYARAAGYLHMDAAALLAHAVALARPLGLRLRVFDAFRPAEAQWTLWAACPDPDFIADPRRGSPHSMGAAVDLTLVDAASGTPLDMGTGFDDMRHESHHGNQDIAPEAQRNRHLLLGIMTAAGWDFYRNEWWHYQLVQPRGRYPVLSDAAAGTRMMPETAVPEAGA